MVALTLVAFICAVTPLRALAALIDTPTAVAATAQATDFARVQTALARADVQAQLERFGVNPAAAAERVNSLTAAELSQLADRLETMPAGGDVLAVIGIVFIVLLILELTGTIDIFKK
jgi:hypothetical protein